MTAFPGFSEKGAFLLSGGGELLAEDAPYPGGFPNLHQVMVALGKSERNGPVRLPIPGQLGSTLNQRKDVVVG
jgi:hypothetical protein